MRDQAEVAKPPPAEAPWDGEVQRTESNMLDEFIKLQGQRCVAYNTLERCMREFRASKQMCAFTDTMREITSTFQTVSLAIIQLGKDLDSLGFKQSAELIEKIQDMEQLKLKLTAEAHIKQQAINSTDKGEDREELRRIKKQLGELIVEINYVLDEIRYEAHPEDH